MNVDDIKDDNETELEQRLSALVCGDGDVLEQAISIISRSNFKTKDRFVAALKQMTPKQKDAGMNWHRGFANATANRWQKLIAAVVALSQQEVEHGDVDDIPIIQSRRAK